MAWCALIFGAVITLESVLVAHQPNWVWMLVFLLGVAYFAKNGFMRSKTPPAAA